MPDRCRRINALLAGALAATALVATACGSTDVSETGPPSVGGCQVFPASRAGPESSSGRNESVWNQDVSGAPVARNSGAIIRQINADGPKFLHPDFGADPHYGLSYSVVPADQLQVPVQIGQFGFPRQSDFGQAPIPADASIESGPSRHVIVLQQGSCTLYEMWHAVYQGGPQQAWQADLTARFDLNRAAPLRNGGEYISSAEASGLPILPGMIRYDEVAAGALDHAVGVAFNRTREAYLHPATHYASSSCDSKRPAMGMRLRLRSDYDTSGLDDEARVIADALKRYGLIVADDGTNWYLQGQTDPGWADDQLRELATIPGRAFQIVKSEAPLETPC